MRLVILADEILKQELLSNGKTNDVEIKWITDIDEFASQENADGCIDLLFENTERRIELLKSLRSEPVIINSVIDTLEDIKAPFVRINAWPGFLKRAMIEASCNNKALKQKAERIFDQLNKKTEWVPDQPGFITARVIAMIINEAWFALEEGVSTNEEIDTAMKLGTNYPNGPFEWGNQIGLKNVCELLQKLSKINTRYSPAKFMKKQMTG